MSQNLYFSVNDLSKKVGDQLSGLDDERSVALESLLLIRKAKDNTLTREYNRLLNVLGPNHPRSQRLLNKIDVNRNLMNDLAAEAVRARIKLPDVSPDIWILTGFVRDPKLTGLPGLIVAFYSVNNTEAKELGSAKTNAAGHFRIDVDGALLSKYPFVYVGVFDEGKNIYKDEDALQPKAGSADYREMIVSG